LTISRSAIYAAFLPRRSVATAALGVISAKLGARLDVFNKNVQLCIRAVSNT
jgi:hypothetical protein